MKLPSLVFIVAPLVLASCATPETRLTSGLREAGMGQGSSKCLAHEMAGELSLGQLIKVSKLGRFRERSLGDMNVSEFLKATRALQDPEILKIATVAAAVCAFR